MSHKRIDFYLLNAYVGTFETLVKNTPGTGEKLDFVTDIPEPESSQIGMKLSFFRNLL